MKKLLTIILFTIGAAQAEPKVLNIDWASVSSTDAFAAKLSGKSQPLPATLMDNLKNTLLPVYLPVTHLYNSNLQVVSDSNFYTVTIPLKEATLFISGDRTYQQDGSKNPTLQQSLAESPPSFIRAEGMVNTNFNRHGANYSLSIECSKPAADSRCTATDYLQKVYRNLQYIRMGARS